jgi:hypothetical protein
MTAIATTDPFAELENVSKAGSTERRTQILRRVTSLSLADADHLNGQLIGVFDEASARRTERANSQTPVRSPAALVDMHFVPKSPVRCSASLAGAG